MGFQQWCPQIKEPNLHPSSSEHSLFSALSRCITQGTPVEWFHRSHGQNGKDIMEKAEESGSEPHLAMVIYRSTPNRPGQLSPAELLNQRKYRALLPIHQYLHPNL